MSEKHPYRGQTEISKGGEPVRFGGVECWWDENAKHFEIGDGGLIQRSGDRWIATLSGVSAIGSGESPQIAAEALFVELRRIHDEIEHRRRLRHRAAERRHLD